MRLLDEHQVDGALPWPALIAALRQGFAAGEVTAPPRQVLTMDLPDGQQASLLLMPAWQAGQNVGVKVVTFFPGNAAKGLATINAGYMMFDGVTGQMRAVLDGDALTARRTAAASALAADYLARPDATELLVVGTGQLAVQVAEAHASQRAYARIRIWGRNADKARAVAATLAGRGLPAEACSDLEAACRGADVISTVTAATTPMIRGDWLKPGSHLDLIGAFKADMRESDDAAVQGARLFVDGRAGAMLAGDLAQPLASGVIGEADILADLAELTQGLHPGRQSAGERTVFKSAGLSAEDLIAAALAVDQTSSG
ncbi:ornithine cyclodeaminase family protein [Phaeovulum sp. W22_SRMD_FR3]|uniref:ornithine cyclodeaminase family protein n=1 Tax=Phaeovulum sp. W22_SRMD_FR3 TaxID=3240274 RepID=UPI003F9E2FF8